MLPGERLQSTPIPVRTIFTIILKARGARRGPWRDLSRESATPGKENLMTRGSPGGRDAPARALRCGAAAPP
jgi:hypothetical protein